MKIQTNNHLMIGIDEIVMYYLPVSKKKARRFVHLYLEPKYIGNGLSLALKQNKRRVNNSISSKILLAFAVLVPL